MAINAIPEKGRRRRRSERDDLKHVCLKHVGKLDWAARYFKRITEGYYCANCCAIRERSRVETTGADIR